MNPLAPLAYLMCIMFVLPKTSCGYNETDLEHLRVLWNSATKKSSNLLRKSSHDDDFKQLIEILSRLKGSDNRWSLFQDLKTVVLRNSYEKVFGHKITMFTNYCGPGDVAGPGNKTVCGFFNGVDECCKAHDTCGNYIGSKSDYDEYPNLPKKQLYFTSLSCKCDVEFYNCLKQTGSIFGDLILAIYSVAQMSCFQHEYKVAKCTKYDE